MPVDARLDPDDPWADDPGFEAPRGPREPTAEFSMPDLPGLKLKQFLARELMKLAVQAASEAPAKPAPERPTVRPRGWMRTMGHATEE
jgi:hypothetical protein